MGAHAADTATQVSVGPHAITIRNLRKAFRAGLPGCSARVTVLDGVDLTADPGEIVTVVGGIGVGKTTLLLCAAGLLKPDFGQIVVARDGHAAYVGTPWHRAHAAISLAQALDTHPTLLLLDDIAGSLGAREQAWLRDWVRGGGTAIIAARQASDTGTLPHRVVTLAAGSVLSDRAMLGWRPSIGPQRPRAAHGRAVQLELA